MSVKTKIKTAKPLDEQERSAILKSVEELLVQHSGEIREMLDESEDRKATVGFKIDMDESESEPFVTTSIRFSTAVTDRRVARLDDTNQITLFNSRSEAQPEVEEQTENAVSDEAKDE